MCVNRAAASRDSSRLAFTLPLLINFTFGCCFCQRDSFGAVAKTYNFVPSDNRFRKHLFDTIRVNLITEDLPGLFHRFVSIIDLKAHLRRCVLQYALIDPLINSAHDIERVATQAAPQSEFAHLVENDGKVLCNEVLAFVNEEMVREVM